MELGLAQGQALREKIQSASVRLEQLAAFRLMQPRWLPYRAYRAISANKARAYMTRALARGDDAWLRRLRGIARGAGVPLGMICLLNALEPMLSSVCGSSQIPVGHACTAVAVRGSRSASGEPIIARNFDYLPLVQPLYAVRREEPSEGFRSLIFAAAPLAGAVDGVNERGLCITYNYAYAVDQPQPAAPISMRISEALRQCSTVSQTAELVSSRTRWGAGMLMLADAEGDLASLELSSTRSQLRRPEGDADVLLHSNCYSTADMQEIEVSSQAVFNDNAPLPLRGRRVLRSAYSRRARLEELLGRYNRLGIDDLALLLADHGPSGEPSFETLCVHSDYWNTTACLQLLPRSRKIRVAYDRACQARFSELALD